MYSFLWGVFTKLWFIFQSTALMWCLVMLWWEFKEILDSQLGKTWQNLYPIWMDFMLTKLLVIFFPTSFDFCQASNNETIVENLGQMVFGDRIQPSPYTVSIWHCLINSVKYCIEIVIWQCSIILSITIIWYFSLNSWKIRNVWKFVQSPTRPTILMTERN